MVWEAWRLMSREAIFDVVGGDWRGRARGQPGGRSAAMSDLLGAARSVGVRARARGAHAARRAFDQAATRVLSLLRGHARALAGVVGAAAARRRRGDRRGVAPGRWRGWASQDRAATRPLAGDRAWLVASGKESQRAAPSLRHAVGVLAGSRAWPDPAGELGDALEALACAARAHVLRFGRHTESWELIVALTGGRLLHGRPRDPP
jgi:hypothetical protein